MNGPCQVVTSSLHDVTLVGRHSYFIILSHSLLTVVSLWLAAERQGFSGCDRQYWYIQCPLGVCIVSIIHALFDYLCSKIACVVRIRE